MKNPPPSQEEEIGYDLIKAFYDLIVKIYAHAYYHDRRAHFFRRWNFVFQIMDWILGLGIAFSGIYLALDSYIRLNSLDSYIRLNSNVSTPLITSEHFYLWLSLGVAAVAIFTLFVSISFDLSQKAEKHRWLTYSYENLKNETTLLRFVNKINKENNQYYEHINKHQKALEEIAKLIKEEYPMLKFLMLVSYYRALQKLSRKELYLQENDEPKQKDDSVEDYINRMNKTAVTHSVQAIGRISCFRNFFINALSMPLGAMKFELEMQERYKNNAYCMSWFSNLWINCCLWRKMPNEPKEEQDKTPKGNESQINNSS